VPAYRCSECGQRTEVRNTRGSRIADHPCGHCGAEGTLQGATAGRTSKHAGRRYERCAACDKRGLDHAHPPFEWEPKHGYAARPGPFPARSPACWREEPVPAARTRHETIHRELEARLGPRGQGGPGQPGSGWASDDEQRRMGLPVGWDEVWADPRLKETCQVCGHAPRRPDDDHSTSHHIGAYRFERGAAAVLVCDGCGHARPIAGDEALTHPMQQREA
jgi:hypothetical protein